MFTNSSEQQITYPQIVMRQINKIQDIAAKELRSSDKTIKNLMGEQEIENEDTRQSFLQSIDILGSLLYSWLSPKETTEFDSYVNLYQMELKEALKNRSFKEQVLNFFEVKSADKLEMNAVNLYFLNLKLQEARSIFRMLLIAFKNNDFLSSEAYGEGAGSSDEGLDAVDDSDSEEETTEV